MTSMEKLGESILAAVTALSAQGASDIYGYRIAKAIKDREGARFLIGHGTLYRALAELEKQGLLMGQWEDPVLAAQELRPRRKFYMFPVSQETEGKG